MPQTGTACKTAMDRRLHGDVAGQAKNPTIRTNGCNKNGPSGPCLRGLRQLRLLAVAIRIPGHRPLDLVTQAIPGVATCMLCTVPFQ